MNYLEIIYKDGQLDPDELKLLISKYPGKEQQILEVMKMDAEQIYLQRRKMQILFGEDWERICMKLINTGTDKLASTSISSINKSQPQPIDTSVEQLSSKIFRPYQSMMFTTSKIPKYYTGNISRQINLSKLKGLVKKKQIN